VPMLGQFLVDPEEDDPVELLDGVVLVDPEPLAELVADVPLVPVVPALVLVVPALVLGVVVAALATSAPPAMRPLVSAPTATMSRTWSFMDAAPSG
jgi:hypothetical protein